MKNIFTLMCCVLALNSFAQTVPFNINYQGMARDADGIPISNADIEATINILQGDGSGPVVFHEEHMTATNTFGIYLIMIGDGDGTDDLQNIDWAETEYYIETIISIDGNPEMTNVSKLNSVPYSFLSFKSVVDEVDDADSDVMNELQQLSLNGTELSITKGNFVDLGTLIEEDETVTEIRINNNGSSIDYKDEDGVTTNLHLCHIVDNCESVTSISYNSIENHLSYVDEDGITNIISLGDQNPTGGFIESLTELT